MAKYVSSKFGNDTLGNGASDAPLQSINSALAIDNTLYIQDGKYLEILTSLAATKDFIGIGNVVLDGTLFNTLTTSSSLNLSIYNFINLYIVGYNDISSLRGGNNYFKYCFLESISLLATSNLSTLGIGTNFENNTFLNCAELTFHNGSYGTPIVKNNTFYLSDIFLRVYDVNQVNDYINNIYNSCNLSLTTAFSTKLKYNHFYSCLIDIASDAYGYVTYDGSIPYNETTPDLSTQNDMRALRERAALLYGGVYTDYFPNCDVYDASTTPCFVDQTSGTKAGFALDPLSPSATANYVTGKHIGAVPVGRAWSFPTDFTLTNIDASGNLISTSSIGVVESNIRDNSKIVLVEEWGNGVIEAMRNGEYTNADKDTANTTLGDTDTLTNGSTYVCESETLSVDDGTGVIVLAVGENFYADSASYVITSSGAGVLRELYPSKRPTIECKFSKTDPTLSGLNYLKFYIKAYDGTTAMPPMMSADGLLGDADTGFSYATATRVPLRWEQRKITIQVDNAKS